MSECRITLIDALTQVAATGDDRYAVMMRHGTMSVGLYAPSGTDPQSPHTRDELYVVIRGTGDFICESERRPFVAGDVLFAPAGAVHRFEEFTEDLAVWVVFYGPEGGEAPAEHG